jgi:uncharacterized protein HemX
VTSLQTTTAWIAAIVLALGVAVVQWQILKRRHLKRLAAERARRHRAEKDTATLLQGAHQQIATLQRELAALREARSGAEATVPPPPQAERETARERLNRMLDEAAPPQAPAHGFADTQPTDRDAPPTGAGVLLQRSTPGR